MRTPEWRRKRLARLHELSTRVANEIADLESEIAADEARLAELKADVARARRQADLCGTDTGYYHHLRVSKTPTCAKCRAVHAAAEADRSQRKRSFEDAA